jgi:hypothetical protein
LQLFDTARNFDALHAAVKFSGTNIQCLTHFRRKERRFGKGAS